jgi:hypothetical protein
MKTSTSNRGGWNSVAGEKWDEFVSPVATLFIIGEAMDCQSLLFLMESEKLKLVTINDQKLHISFLAYCSAEIQI